MDPHDAFDREVARLSDDQLLAFYATHSPDLVLAVNPAGQIIFAGPSSKDLLGYATDALVGRRLSEFIHPEDYEQEQTGLEQLDAFVRPDQGVEERDVRLLKKDGSWCWFSIKTRSMDNATPQRGVLLVGRDIDERRRQEDRLRMLERAIEAANNSICIAEATGDMPLIYVNNGFCELSQYSRDEVIGQNCRFLQQRADGSRDNEQEGVQEVARAVHEGAFVRTEVRNYKKDGTPFVNELFITPVKDDDGTVTHFIGVQNDVTERVEAEARYRALAQELEARVRQRTTSLEEQKTELQHVNEDLREARDRAEEGARVKSAFMANMSHEIRTPLTGILGFASVLAQRVPPELRTLAERIERAGARLLETLNLVLDLSQLDAGKRAVDLDAHRVYPEVEETIKLFQPRADAKGLLLTLQAEPGAPEALARFDPAALTGILNNLIGNAVKFTDRGEVRVEVGLAAPEEAEIPNGAVAIRVIDTGRGIDPTFVPHLFEPFSQESTGLGRTHEGSGLGLSIVKRLAELMHARVTVKSQRLRGSTFTVYLPYESQDDGTRLQLTPNVAVPLHPDARLLVVEDNLDSQYLLQMVLEELCPVDVASNATEAFHLASTRRYNAIFMDVNLGTGPSGIDVLHRLRALPETQGIPVIALTAYALPGDKDRLIQSGFTDYVPKPFTVDALVERARALVERAGASGDGVPRQPLS